MCKDYGNKIEKKIPVTIVFMEIIFCGSQKFISHPNKLMIFARVPSKEAKIFGIALI